MNISIKQVQDLFSLMFLLLEFEFSPISMKKFCNCKINKNKMLVNILYWPLTSEVSFWYISHFSFSPIYFLLKCNMVFVWTVLRYFLQSVLILLSCSKCRNC